MVGWVLHPINMRDTCDSICRMGYVGVEWALRQFIGGIILNNFNRNFMVEYVALQRCIL